MRILFLLFICSPRACLSLFAGPKEDYIAANQAAHDEAVETLTLIHKALIDYMLDHEGHWPEIDFEKIEGPGDFLEFWKKSLEPYGVPPERWQHSADRQSEMIGYNLTFFDTDAPLAAYKFKTQPWAISTQLFGKEGARYVLLPDSTILILPFDDDVIPKADPGTGKADPVEPARIPKSLEKFRREAP